MRLIADHLPYPGYLPIFGADEIPAGADGGTATADPPAGGDGGEGGEGGQAPAAPSSPDVAQSLQRMEGHIESLREQVSQRQTFDPDDFAELLENRQPPAGQQPVGAQPEATGGQTLEDVLASGDPAQLQTYIDARAQAQAETLLEQHQGPLQELQAKEYQREINTLLERYPDLRNEEVADRVDSQAAELAERRGVPALADDPEFLEMVYLANRAREIDAAEKDASKGDEEVPVEGGGGRRPATPQTDPGDEIVAAGSSASTEGDIFGFGR